MKNLADGLTFRDGVAQVVTWATMAQIASTVALMVASTVATLVAPVASMASMDLMVASLDWLKLMTAEPKRGDERVDGLTQKNCEERADGLTFKFEGASTVALKVASLMASMASMVASLDWLMLMTAEPKRGDERADGLTQKIVKNELMG